MKHFGQILKTTGIIKAAPSDNISTALSHLSSSHDAAFVFDDKNHFMGVINPYYCLIRSFNPGHTKVEHCLFHPPRVNHKDSFGRIGHLMAESKIHYLPVFNDKNEFVGITSARRLLSLMKDLPVNAIKVHEILKGKNSKLISVYQEDTIGEAMNFFKKYKVSKLIVIDQNMKLKGILSYYDLIPYLVAPGMSKSRSRGQNNNHDKEKLMNMKVKNYAKTTTVTQTPGDSVKDIINCILTKKKGSVIIVDPESHPIGILTTKDMFDLLEPQHMGKPVEIVAKHIAKDHMKMLQDLVNYVQSHIQRDAQYRKAKVFVEEERDGGLFNVHVSLTPEKGKMEMIKREGKDLRPLIKEIKDALKIVEKDS